jgi:hypothetical protein
MTPILRRISIVTSALLLVSAVPAAGQGFVVHGPDSSRITFNGRVQTIFNTTSVDDQPATETELRRVRLEANLQLNRVVGAKIQPEFAGSRVSLRDAYVRLTLDPALQLWAGQAHRPFGVVSPYSTTRVVPIEKGLRIRGIPAESMEHYNILLERGYSDRDVGIQARGEVPGAPLGLAYAVGWFNGPARTGAPKESSGQVVARVTALPLRGVRVGASWSRRDFILVQPAGAEKEAGDAWGADVEVERGALHLIGEVSRGDYDALRGSEFFGGQAIAAYRTGRLSSTIAAVEPLLRVSHGDLDGVEGTNLSGGTLWTPGVNVWLGGLNRLALNYEIWDGHDDRSARSFKAMFQVAF